MLYAGKGGRVVSGNEDAVHAGASLPPYSSADLHSSSSSKKCRLNPDDNLDPDVNDEPHPMLMALIRGIHTRLDDIEKTFKTRLDDIESQSKTRHKELEARFDTVEESLVSIRNREDIVYTPCRFNSTERDGLLQAVDDRCEEHFDAFLVQSYEANEDLEKERNDGITIIREEAQEVRVDIHDTVTSFREMLKKAGDAFREF
ncbi:hypothetical protein ACQKWADRAFT_210051 [Trichoderma austrokoningii]